MLARWKRCVPRLQPLNPLRSNGSLRANRAAKIQSQSKTRFMKGQGMSLQTIKLPNDNTANLNKVYDAVVVGSGAAGGMAAYALTARGMKVLLLEAGKRINTTEELKS